MHIPETSVPVKILLIEDNPLDARIIIEYIKECCASDFDIQTADRLSAALTCLSINAVDVILLNLSLSDNRGLDTFITLNKQFSDIPVIILSGLDDNETGIKAIQLGAQDYLVKRKFDSELLTKTIRYAIERKQAEEAIIESEKKFKSISNAAQDAIIMLDHEGKISFWNHAATEIFGYTPEEIITKNLEILMGKEDYLKYLAAFPEFQKTGKGAVVGKMVKLAGLHKNGSEIIIELSLSAINIKGKWHAAGIARDITKRKLLENKISENYQIQEVVNSILKFAVEDISLDELAKYAFEKAMGIKCFNFDKKGCIFLASDEPDSFIMKYQTGIGDNILEACKKINTGKCHCGKAALLKKVIFSPAVDHAHEVHYPGMLDHGHYCVPILFTGKVLGIINVYLKSGHKYSRREVNFLQNMSNTLAGVIVRKNNEAELINTMENLEKMVKARTSELEKKNNELQSEINERAKVESDLVQSETKYRTLIEQAVDAIFISDPRGNIIDVNNASIFLTGYTQKELLRLNMKDLFGDETLKAAPLRYDLLDKSEIVITERMLTQKSGTLVPIEMKTRKMPDRTYQSFLRDMTEHKRMGESIKEALQKEKELSLLKSRFISVISHEFRTPLAGIFGSVQLLERHGNKWNDEKRQEYYKRIYSSIQYTNVLLDDVSIIGKDENGRLSVTIRAVNVKKLCNQVICDLKAIYGELTAIEIENNFKTAEINTDEGMLRHILNNIISNGIKYSDKKPVDLIIEGNSEKGIIFTVSDRGIGIPAEDMKHIFEPFNRASNVETIKGTGIGLAIVKRCVDLLQGAIEIESAEGKGTTVKVVLPISPK
ncbi:MAG: PAS domain S-box protein [Bacteroidia bacterium]|nr:PAS domain S-box protein [Bacteroidia bacterium]